MPNWCNDYLIVKGKESELKKFRKFVESKHNPLDFEKIISSKESEDSKREDWKKLSKEEKKRWFSKDEKSEKQAYNMFWYNNGGYNWCVDNWGTKWNSCNTAITERSKEEIIYNFDTAWSPPIPIIEKLIAEFPKLNFDFGFEEWGMAFAGEITSRDGNIVIHQSYDIDIGTCPNCDYTNIKRRTNDKYECSDCGHKFTEKESEEYQNAEHNS